jgi:glycosyltransferase involved in cell wall biosynthesis
MAARNAGERGREAVRSILEQTYRDLELIVVDDGSADDTPRILSEWAMQDDRIRFYRNERSMGLAHCLNRCTSEAKGEYLARMDADDVSLPSRLEKQVQYLDAHPEVDILGTAAFRVDNDGKIVGKMGIDTDHRQMASRIYLRNPFVHPTVMTRKSVFERLGGYDESLLRGQDYDLWLRASSVCRFANLPEPLLLYRVGPAVHWRSLLYSVWIKCRSIQRERRPWWYYYYPFRSFLSVPLAVARYYGWRRTRAQ